MPGERTIKKRDYEENIRQGRWEVEYEPNSLGRATIIKRKTGERETIMVDSADERLDAACARLDGLTSRLDVMEVQDAVSRHDAAKTPEEAYKRAFHSFKAEDLRKAIQTAKSIAEDPRNSTMGSHWMPKQVAMARQTVKKLEDELEAFLGPLRP